MGSVSDIIFSNIELSGITGSVEYDSTQVYILYGDDSCSDWTWEGVDMRGGSTSDVCDCGSSVRLAEQGGEYPNWRIK
ncbi:endopolygalacturonase C [Penicillium cinerascens]|uniref:Endopolygalacturonase C n=1 Tax=Penicillium cinerascens TaxID=70096 RepID=A0A9W9JGI3_9EURO|nr:endopolygalacturonase C [Penicillium cinerascens]KAJ5194520.1 endopolygalacturonase C [Penicillium cinerascens]